MRRLIAVALLAVLMAMPVAAAPVDVDHGPSIAARVLEHVTEWLAKLGIEPDPNGAENDDSDRDDHFPPLDGIGMGLDPNG